jgi:hypothetical protein
MVYSFLNVVCGIVGPGGAFNLGAGASVSEEGISIEPVEDKNVMTIGADGKGQHSLLASDAAKVTVRLLKTSPINAALMAMFDGQSISSGLWGQNVITVADIARGDITIAQSCAFTKKPAINYKKEADLIEWTFDSISATTILGIG